MMLELSQKAAKPVTVVCGDLNCFFFKPKRSIFLTLTNCFLCFYLTRK